MALSSLLRASKRPDPYVCARCAFQASNAPSKTTRRWLKIEYTDRVAEAEMTWGERASSIRAGKEKSMLTILEERGLVQTVTGKRADVDRMMTNRRLGAYVGIDPTAPSIHVGHMIPLMSLFWMYVNGYHTVSLLGGATAKIGDPTDRLTTREKQHSSIGNANMANMHTQLKKLWLNVEAYGSKYGYKRERAWHRELINNNVWWNSLPMLQVLQLLGPGMRLGSMLARDTVKNKMSKGDGMSFAEFTYPLMQAWDWWYMFHKKGIQIQIGGSDQFGNITAGIDAVKYISTHHPDPHVREEASAVGEPFGFTVPLLTTASGQKFGKSAGNAIWLDNELTSSFDLYKYFLSTADADVEKYLKMFTFMPLEDITTLVKESMKSPEHRKAQHKLAAELVELVHGREEAIAAEQQHHLLFKNPGSLSELVRLEDAAAKDDIVTLNNKPQVNTKLPRHVIFQRSIGKILHAAGIARSTTDGHKLVAKEGAYIGTSPHERMEPMNSGYISWGKILGSWKPEDVRKFLVHDDLLIFRKGKHNIKIVQVVPDDQYAVSGDWYPGMTREWRNGVLKVMQVKESITAEEVASIDKLLADDEAFFKKQSPEAHVNRMSKELASSEEDASAKAKKESTSPENDVPEETSKAKDKPDLPKIDFVKRPKPVEGAGQADWVDRL
ncbi:related to tyrosine--trna ligase precursor, mitochondrial (cyt-18) [Phialocephala subalpina]|uniref:Tyrosine--tRNA ligase n=1 Tax=Phialocephala subalpina TaxID=576137 RepID=A0A1L7WST9_9HELO|nr:related to tyrosine--trna ligase precursor, mitochondrial (cyt-18) [Phialocephala subalpina]